MGRSHLLRFESADADQWKMRQAPVFHSTAFAASLATTLMVLVLAAGPSPARSEYRAYQLLITDTRANQNRLVISTLDHIQYPDYHHLRRGEAVSIQATWMCRGRTDLFKPICRNPREAPAANQGLETVQK